MTFAVIETGGKQYKVTSDQKIKVEKLNGNAGDKIFFDRVLLVADEESVQIGTPYVSGVRVETEVVRQARERKKIVFKYGSKTRRRIKKGHRQHFTEIKILGIK